MPFFGGGTGDYIIVGTNIKGGTSAAPAVIGDNNMALGNGALQNLTNGDGNIAIGNNAANALITDSFNVVIGEFAAATPTILDRSVVIGSTAYDTNGSSTLDVFIGNNASVEFDGINSNNNIVIGGNAYIYGFGAGDYEQCTIVGAASRGGPSKATIFGYNNFCQNESIFVGNNITAGANVSGTDGVIAVGYDILGTFYGMEIVPGGIIRIGDGSNTEVFIGGINISEISTGKFPDGIIVGDPGIESSGININGVIYESTFKVSDIDGTNFAQTILHRHSTTLEPLIVGARSNSNTDAHADVTAGMGLFSVYGVGWTGGAGGNYKIFGTEQFAADNTGTISGTSAPGKWTLSLTPDGALAPEPVITARNDKSIELAGKLTIQNGKYVEYILAQWGVPSGVAQSGTVANNGALTLGSNLSRIYSGGIWLYFPANALYAGSVAGAYWTVMSSLTVGTVFDTILSGIPYIPSSPTPIVAVGPGAYNGVTTLVVLASVTIPGGSLRNNGGITATSIVDYKSSGGTKNMLLKIGATIVQFFSTAALGSNLIMLWNMINRGLQNLNINTNNNVPNTTGSLAYEQTTIDTSTDKTLTINAQKTTATDFIIYESVSINIKPSD